MKMASDLINKELLDLLNKVEYVSFDIYDTLIFRSVLYPSDVFDLVEDKYNHMCDNKLVNFKSNRIKAEKKCRKLNEPYEISIEDIYMQLKKEIPNINIKLAMQLEKELEINVSLINNEMKAVYDWCIKNNKKIFITSDMYLDSDTITSILKKNGIVKYEKLYLSSIYKVRKKNGELFKVILDDYSISKNNILHIGDNLNSDYNMPKENGFLAWHIDNVSDFVLNKYFCKETYNTTLLKGFYKHNFAVKDYFYEIGQVCLGPLLYGFSYFLKEQIDSIKPDKIVFLARDGAIMKRAYESLFGKSNKNVYAYGSRRSLIVPTLWKNFSAEKIQNSIHFYDRMPVKVFLERIGLDAEIYKTRLVKIGIKLDDRIQGTDLLNDNKFNDLYNELKDDIVSVSKKEHVNAINYWDKVIGDAKKVVIVDIGWNGNMQNALSNLVENKNIKFFGLYLGVNPKTKYNFFMKGFLFDKEHNMDMKGMLDNYSGILETMFMTNHGSLKKYTNKAPFYELYPNEYESDIEYINGIQNGAIDFILKFDSFMKSCKLDISLKDAYSNLMNLGLYPSYLSSVKFGDIKFYNSDYCYLARPKNGRFNLKELMDTNWRIGYLKRCFKINLNYYNFVNIIKKLKNIFVIVWRRKNEK